ncbi:hypothetical protein CXF96_08635 [Stenotrophomonas sp. Betaine-02u-21]|uniref:hypothetical protein n=1 Tax=unclassified Stenotrophomonas TaxID=196198 RepID=UPI000C34873A|nr:MULTISPECIES: hypothetical protein [unclassified Stenotrophomonas]PKH71444.1 hypothetical protein CXF90_10935 [Stenotrophomonas sp. Betaine-02u-23]PKH74368.1 hypothetical protein CXF96_08635 [Stenotrophomonas sp. Betaine-02u-21]PKH96577.1 hypothetical protein CXG43_06670 [Stenotrophomonas sp. Bg11-02]
MERNEANTDTPSTLDLITNFGVTTFSAASGLSVDRKHAFMSWAQCSDIPDQLEVTKSHAWTNLKALQGAMNDAHPLRGPIDSEIDDLQSGMQGLEERILSAQSPDELAQAVLEYQEPVNAAASMWSARTPGTNSGES